MKLKFVWIEVVGKKKSSKLNWELLNKRSIFFANRVNQRVSVVPPSMMWPRPASASSAAKFIAQVPDVPLVDAIFARVELAGVAGVLPWITLPRINRIYDPDGSLAPQTSSFGVFRIFWDGWGHLAEADDQHSREKRRGENSFHRLMVLGANCCGCLFTDDLFESRFQPAIYTSL